MTDVPLPMPVKKQRLDAAFPWMAGTPMQKNLQRLMSALEGRFAWLEYAMYEGSLTPEQVLADTIDTVNNILGPLTADLQDAAALGFLMAQSATVATLQTNVNVELTLVDGPGLRMFQPTPFVFLTHSGGDYVNWCAARVSDFHRETGVLTVRPIHIEGNAGPWSDWDITASAAMPAAVETWAAQIEADVLAAANNADIATDGAETAQSLKSSIFARYLGGKPANPTLDDEGNAIPNGSMYWNTGVGELRIKSGGSWEAYSPASVAANIFSDLNDVPENYTGAGGKHVRVKASVDGLEFTDAPYTKAEADARYDAIGAAAAVDTLLDNHIADQGNPHATTKTQVGLSNVTNDAQLKRSGADWAGFAAKAALVDDDNFLAEDSEASGAKKVVSFLNAKSSFKTYFDTLYANAATQTAVTAILANAPANLNTFDEVAAALGDDPSFSTNVTNALAAKAPLANPTLTGHPAAPTQAAGSNNTDIATCAYVDAAVLANQAFPSGTRSSFQQTAAPTGWTKDTTYNDHAMRLVNGTVGSGGVYGFSGMYVSGWGVAAHVIDGNELTYHAHGYESTHDVKPNVIPNSGSSNMWQGYWTNTATAGASWGHGHTVDLRVKYVDFIIAVKN